MIEDLPPSDDIFKYAVDDASAYRFYMSDELAATSDWKLLAHDSFGNSKVLPVHSQLLGMHCNVFMECMDFKNEKPIDLGCDTVCALALLRFVYDEQSIEESALEAFYLSIWAKNKNIALDVVTLLDKVGYKKLYECAVMAVSTAPTLESLVMLYETRVQILQPHCVSKALFWWIGREYESKGELAATKLIQQVNALSSDFTASLLIAVIPPLCGLKPEPFSG